MKKLCVVIYLGVFCALLSGCANSPIKQPWCSVAGALIGGASAWAINEEVADNQDGDAPVAVMGAAGGAAIGALLCRQEQPPEPEPAPQPEPEPDPCSFDDDQDGVDNCADRCANTAAGTAVDADGCPQVGETLLILEGVNFAFDSAELTPEAENILGEAVQVLNDNASVNVQVEGHTDSIGSDTYNQQLSERRAQAVVDYLASQGIDPSRMQAVGMGESEPVASNDTEDGRYKNRRVEFEVIE